MHTSNWLINTVISVFFALVYLGKGAIMTLFGQVLFDLANYLSVETASLVTMVTVRAIGYGVGTVGSGFTFDRFRRLSYLQLTAIISVLLLCSSAIPATPNLILLGVVIFVQGVCFGSFNNGAHTVLLSVWEKRSGPAMQLIHFAFALGAFLAPLIAKPFLTEEISYTNISCSELMNMYESSTHNISHCVAMVIENCSNDSSLESFHVTDFCPIEPSFRFAYSYWILVMPFVLALPAFPIYASISKECSCQPPAMSKENEMKSDTEVDDDKVVQPIDKTTISYPDTIAYKIFLFALLVVIILLYVGMEHTYGNFIFAYSINSQLNFTKSQASLISSVFWGSFTFFRLIAISLALCRIPSWILLSINVGGGLLGSVVLLIWPVTPTAVWIASSIIGCSMASIYPNIMVWLSEHGPTSGKSIGFLLFSSTLAKVTIATPVGALVTSSVPSAFVYAIFIGMLLSSLLLVTLFVGVRYWTKVHFQQKDKPRTHKYAVVLTDEEEKDVLTTDEFSVM